ncbi:MAG: hypothetical protein HOQ18_14400 [Dermatophilaceae bacterium]|nr:hypothetical protein [Dermatophilaceae bacterium]NUO91994.1 hypothetical protein [Dermatophilaceae bacterium]
MQRSPVRSDRAPLRCGRFPDDPLPDHVLTRILDNARFAPSGGNRQGTQGDGVKQRLGTPEPFAVAAVDPLGRPVEHLKRLSRVAASEMTHLDHWSGPPLPD